MNVRYCPAPCWLPAQMGNEIVTLEGMQEEAKQNSALLWQMRAAEQCGFCNPGFIMNVFAMLRGTGQIPQKRISWSIFPEICAVVRDLWDRPEVS